MTTLLLVLIVIALLAIMLVLLAWLITYKKKLTMPAPQPLPNYHFDVQLGTARAGFTEVSGLSVVVDTMEHRDGSSPEMLLRKMPGMHKYSNIVLKRGLVRGDNDFFAWMRSILHNQPERRDVVIRLLDETHTPVFVWRLRNAFPVKYEGPTLQANASEIAMESLELAHEGLTVEAV